MDLDFSDIRNYCLQKAGVTDGYPFGPGALVFKVASKMFGLLSENGGNLWLNLKNTPLANLELREQYPGITAGYHMSKVHWNTLVLDGSLPVELVFLLIDNSYDLVFQSLRLSERAAIESASRP